MSVFYMKGLGKSFLDKGTWSSCFLSEGTRNGCCVDEEAWNIRLKTKGPGIVVL